MSPGPVAARTPTTMFVASIADRILSLHGSAALAVVFLMPLLESGLLVGFFFPGELAVLLGGVLAQQHRAPLPAVLVAAVAGAIIGDSLGYEVGRRWGRRVLDGTVGRFVKASHIDNAERYLATKGGKAVFLGRFTAALRVLIPGFAGMSGLRYRTFLIYNAIGGTIWACTFVLLGYAAGSSWRRVEHAAGVAGIVGFAVVVIAGLTWLAVRRRRRTVAADVPPSPS